MPSALRKALQREVGKLIARHNLMCQAAADHRRRFEKRSGCPAAPPNSKVPEHWSVNRRFDPYYVRSRLDRIAHGLFLHLRDRTYQPEPILLKEIPKPHGGKRVISLLTIPDAAISYALGTRLIDRNAYLFTSYTYAYRKDRNAHHAIQHLMSAIRGSSRVFVLEFDFSKYFDSIEHEYLLKTLEQHFLTSDRERELIRKLLRAPRARGVKNYIGGRHEEVPARGIPQGSTLSLFLANVACHQLDREVENNGATFARYADDTLIVCDSYDKAHRCARLVLEHGYRSGTKVNFAKSDGISLLTEQRIAEVKSKQSVDFLAHALSPVGVGLSQRSVTRMKKRISQIIQRNLLLQPSRGVISPDRVGHGFRDWDLVTCINELRRYVYGRLSNAQIESALDGTARFNLTRCAMSFYPTIDPSSAEALRGLDGWLMSTLVRAHRRRVRLLAAAGLSASAISQSELLSGSWYSYPAVRFEPQVPSLFKSWLYVRRCAQFFGLERFPSPLYEYG